ncbi:MAG: hypothetical protein CMH52_05860 [Myxococcales bacterium]|nr:hypothetical protein [Myxococcales bacterium]
MINLTRTGTFVAVVFAAMASIGCGELGEDHVGANYEPKDEQAQADPVGLNQVDLLALNAIDVAAENTHIELGDTHPVLQEIDLHDRFDQNEFDFAAIEPFETDELVADADAFESTPGLGDGSGDRNEWKKIMTDVCIKLGGDLSDTAFGPGRGEHEHNAVSFYCLFPDESEMKLKSFVIGGEGSCKSHETLADWAQEICESDDNIMLHKGYGECGGDKDDRYHRAMLFVCKSL